MVNGRIVRQKRKREEDKSHVDEIVFSPPAKKQKFALSFVIYNTEVASTRKGGKIIECYSPKLKKDVIVKQQPIEIHKSNKFGMQEIENLKILLENVSVNSLGEHYYGNNICKLLFHGVEETHAYMVLEKGKPVFDFMVENWGNYNKIQQKQLLQQNPSHEKGRKCKVSANVASSWEKLTKTFVKDLAAGLEHIHNLGFSHNDIKIDNCIICLNENGEQTLKLIDFETMGKHKTNETRIIGTRRYFSPECHHKNYDTNANDLWCFGVSVFMMMFKGLPFENIQGKAFAAMTENEYGTFSESTFQNLKNQTMQDLLLFWKLQDVVTEKAMDFCKMFFRPQSIRCQWADIYGHSWLLDH